MNRTWKHEAGFSLIELLIVVAIIGIIAAIAIPNLLASRRAANEGSAMQSVRTLVSSEAVYLSTGGSGAYGDLAALRNASLIDGVLAGAATAATAKSGYIFSITPIAAVPGSAATYIGGAAPALASGVAMTGTREFETDPVGIIFYNPGTTPIPTSGSASGVAIGNN